MTSSVEIIIQNSRPEGFRGRIERYLPKIGLALYKFILKLRDDLPYLSNQIDATCAKYVSAMCILFAEDLHCRLGLWNAVEKWNAKIFHTPLPFIIPEGDQKEDLKGYDVRRVKFFLWQVLSEYFDNEDTSLVMNPHDKDLCRLAQNVSEFLTTRFSPKLPQNSGIRRFLELEHPEAPDLKRKLVWLGTQSYLFSRNAPPQDFNNVEEFNYWIQSVDDYICQDCSRWSGMGALEVLADVLHLEGKDREDLMDWSNRLQATYEVLSRKAKGEIVKSIEALNLLNDEVYRVEIGKDFPVTEGEVVLGALIPWRGVWFWSGTQRPIGSMTPKEKEELKNMLQKENLEWVYRSCPDKLEKAKESALRHHKQFVHFYGDDLKTFPNVEEMMSSEKERLEAYNQQIAWANSKPGKEPKLKNFQFNENMMKWKGQVAAFSDPEHGISYIPDFKILKEALTQSSAYSEEMWQRFSRFMEDPTVPPSCVRRLTKEYGQKGLLAHYRCSDQPTELVQEFFLRSMKGRQFRKVFPNVAIA